jgi:hypothetical protein
LVDAQEQQVILNPLLDEARAQELASGSEPLDGILGIVVVPRDAVVIEEREQTGSILLNSIGRNYSLARSG